MLRSGGNFESFRSFGTKAIQHSAHSAPIHQLARLATSIDSDPVGIARICRIDNCHYRVKSIVHEIALPLYRAPPEPDLALSPAQGMKTEVLEIGEQLGMIFAPNRVNH